MAWVTWLRGGGLAVVLLALLWAAAQGQERPVLALVEAGSERLVVGWSWSGDDEPAAFSVHWRRRVSGAGWESARAEGAARRFEITGLWPDSTYIVRVRALDAAGRGIRAPGGGRPFDLRAVFDTIQLPVPAAPTLAFDGERATASWDAVEGATGYELAWGLAGETAATERLGADALEFATGPLAAGSRYEFRLRSLHQRDRSAPSAAASLTPAAWPNAAPTARFEFHRAAGMLVEWDAVAGAEDYVVAWQKEGDDSRAGETAATGTSVLVTREGGFFTGNWLLRVRAAKAGTWSETTRVWVESPAPELRFSLESSRQLCTEGTLTEIRWRGGGGAGNLWPHVSRRMIGANTYRVKVNCGLIPRTADGEIDETQRDAVITGFLLDGRGTIKSASIRVPRAEALPAPIETDRGETSGRSVIMRWGRSEEGKSAVGDKREMLILMRWKEPNDADWTYSRLHSGVGNLYIRSSTDKEELIEQHLLQAAELREAIEAETPDALQWSAIIDHQFHKAPQNLRATTTHDTIVIEWDAQMASLSGYLYDVLVTGPQGFLGALVRAASGVPNRVMFTGLPADTEFSIQVITDRFIQIGLPSSITARTKVAPAGYLAPPRGPQNLHASATSNSITLRWDPPFAEADELYSISLRDEHGETVAGETLYAKPEDGFSVTFSGLPSNSTYHAIVTHRGIVKASVRIQVTTGKDPGDSVDRDTTGQQGIPEIGNSLINDTFSWPINLRDRPYITGDPWEWRASNYYHYGIDIGSPDSLTGKPVYAAGGGKFLIANHGMSETIEPIQDVAYCPNRSGSYYERFIVRTEKIGGCYAFSFPLHGRTAVIIHNSGHGPLVTKYAHLASFADWINTAVNNSNLSDEETLVLDVERGQLLGIIGASGVDDDGKLPLNHNQAYDVHLHFEVRDFSDPKQVVKNWQNLDSIECASWLPHVDEDGKRDVHGIKRQRGRYNGYCHGNPNDRNMRPTVLDPEWFLPPMPPSSTETGEYRWDLENMKAFPQPDLTKPVFNFESVTDRSGIVPLGINPRDIKVSLVVHVWRPSFYDWWLNTGPQTGAWGHWDHYPDSAI